uniref:PE301R n=1 Tax=African swine fever virus TaxID=10497 RepID=A0A6G7KU05_ASF
MQIFVVVLADRQRKGLFPTLCARAFWKNQFGHKAVSSFPMLSRCYLQIFLFTLQTLQVQIFWCDVPPPRLPFFHVSSRRQALLLPPSTEKTCTIITPVLSFGYASIQSSLQKCLSALSALFYKLPSFTAMSSLQPCFLSLRILSLSKSARIRLRSRSPSSIWTLLQWKKVSVQKDSKTILCAGSLPPSSSRKHLPTYQTTLCSCPLQNSAAIRRCTCISKSLSPSHTTRCIYLPTRSTCPRPFLCRRCSRYMLQLLTSSRWPRLWSPTRSAFCAKKMGTYSFNQKWMPLCYIRLPCTTCY